MLAAAGARASRAPAASVPRNDARREAFDGFIDSLAKKERVSAKRAFDVLLEEAVSLVTPARSNLAATWSPDPISQPPGAAHSRTVARCFRPRPLPPRDSP